MQGYHHLRRLLRVIQPKCRHCRLIFYSTFYYLRFRKKNCRLYDLLVQSRRIMLVLLLFITNATPRCCYIAYILRRVTIDLRDNSYVAHSPVGRSLHSRRWCLHSLAFSQFISLETLGYRYPSIQVVIKTKSSTRRNR